MTRFLMLLLFAVLATPTPTWACPHDDPWEDIVASLWEGKLTEPPHTDAISCPELRLMRNIPYARHGYIFGKNWVGRWFAEDVRYKPKGDVNAIIEQLLTPNDRANVERLLSAEAGMQCRTWWERNGENPTTWSFGSEAGFRSMIAVAPTVCP